MKKISLLFFIVLVMLCGCKGAVIRDYTEQPISSGLTLTAVEKCIMEAGSKHGWVMRKIEPGLIEGTLVVRTHSAVVDIPYSTETYSILYKDSTNLKASGDGTIHKNYNKWILNLEREINKRLIAEAYK